MQPKTKRFPPEAEPHLFSGIGEMVFCAS